MTLSSDVLGLLRNPESPNFALRDALMDMGVDVASVWMVKGQSLNRTTTADPGEDEEWDVAGFLAEESAVALAEEMNRFLQSIGKFVGCAALGPSRTRTRHDADPNLTIGVYGTRFFVAKIPLRAE